MKPRTDNRQPTTGNFFGVLLLSLICVAAAQEPEPKALVAEALRTGSGDFGLSEYTHIQKITRRDAGRDGKVEVTSSVKEAFVPKGVAPGRRVRWVYVLIEENGKPLPADRIEKERIKAGERLQRAELETAAPADASAQEARAVYFGLQIGSFLRGLTLNVRTILQHFEFAAPRREEIAGRACLALDFRPPVSRLFTGEEEYLNRLGGTAWFDLEERVLVKLTGWPVDAPVREGNPYVEYESLRTPEGKWLPRRMAIFCDGRKRFFKKEFRDVIAEFSKYERFGAAIRDVRIND
ncbi:MAG: hypothetical protein SF339_06755 [Blastocatellia bacterium]|nr:hypothetical protein [Blastocatellia bacterium]